MYTYTLAAECKGFQWHMVHSTNFSHAGGFSTQNQARFKVAPSLCILNVFINVCSHALLSYQLTDLFFF